MPDNSKSNNRIARNSVFLSVRSVIVLCISLYTSRMVLHALGVEDYGIYNVVCGFVSMFTFLNTSMSNGIQRFFNYELGKNGEEGARKVYCTALYIQILLAIIIVVLTESVGLWYLHNKMVLPPERMTAAEWIFQLSIISFILVILKVPYTATIMAHERMDFYAIVNISEAIFKLILVIILPCLYFDKLIVWGIFGLMIQGLSFLLCVVYAKHNFSELIIEGEGTNKTLFKSMLGFSSWNIFSSFSNMMRDQGVNMIINFFYGPVLNAARGIAMQINAAITNLVGNILTPVRPQVIQSYAKGEVDRSLRLTLSISKFSLCFLMLLSLPVCVEIDTVLHIWLGEIIPKHTQTLCIIIIATTSVLIPNGALANLVHATGRIKHYALIGSTIKFLSVPAAFFIMKYGYSVEWALVVVLLFEVVGLFIGMFVLKHLINFSIFNYIGNVLLPMIPVLLLSLLAEISIRNAIQNQYLGLVLVVVVGSTITLLTFFFISLSKYEKGMVVQFVMNYCKNKLKKH